MKVKGNEKIFVEETEIIDIKHEHAHDHDYDGGVLKIKTAIGKIRKQESSQYRHIDPKRFKKHK